VRRRLRAVNADNIVIHNNKLERVGVSDTYGRLSWCRKRAMKKANASYVSDFGSNEN